MPVLLSAFCDIKHWNTKKYKKWCQGVYTQIGISVKNYYKQIHKCQ